MDLKRKPSAKCIAAEKYKTKPANTPRPVRKSSSVRVPATTSINTDTHPSAIASTSRTLTTPATQEETFSDLKELASMDTVPDDTIATNQSIQQTQNEELNLQPSRGPREGNIVNTIDQFLDKNYEDVLHTSNIQTNFSLSASDRNLTGRPVLPLGWIIPDGTNRSLEEIKDKKISNDHSPGGGQAGAVVMTLQRLEPYFGTQFFLVDLETGEMFAYIRQQWRRTGLYSSNKPFVINDLITKVE